MMKKLVTLFLTFAKVGVMTFGGGYAMLPILQREVVEKKGWVTEEELADYFAIGQCTPGVIAVNTATFVGQKLAGVAGGIVATLGVVFPPLIIISTLAEVIIRYAHLAWVQHAFAGIRIAVSALIISTLIGMIRKGVRAPLQIALCIAAFVLVACFKTPVTYIVRAAALTGVLTGMERTSK